jgi:GST-like protein
MIDLYGASSPNVIKVVLMLEELELPYTFHHVLVWKGEQYQEAFGKLNPNRKVPVIVDSDGPGGKPLTVFESAAILTYLAEKTGKLLPASGSQRYEVLQWMMIQMTGIGPMFGQHAHFSHFAAEEKYAGARYKTEAIRLIDLVDQRLGQATYLGGDAYSIADVATYPWMSRMQVHGLPTDRPNFVRWKALLETRPGVQRAIARRTQIQTVSEPSKASVTPEELDRMFGRGAYARQA